MIQDTKEAIETLRTIPPWTLVILALLPSLLGGGIAAAPTIVNSRSWVSHEEFTAYKEKAAERDAQRNLDVALLTQQVKQMNTQLQDLIVRQTEYQREMQTKVTELIRTVDGRLPSATPRS